MYLVIGSPLAQGMKDREQGVVQPLVLYYIIVLSPLHPSPLEAVPEAVCPGDLDVLGPLVDGPHVIVVPHAEPVHPFSHDPTDFVVQLDALVGIHLDLLRPEEGLLFRVADPVPIVSGRILSRIRSGPKRP